MSLFYRFLLFCAWLGSVHIEYRRRRLQEALAAGQIDHETYIWGSNNLAVEKMANRLDMARWSDALQSVQQQAA